MLTLAKIDVIVEGSMFNLGAEGGVFNNWDLGIGSETLERLGEFVLLPLLLGVPPLKIDFRGSL